MRQILFHIPFVNLPIYGYGLMLFFAFIGCSWLAKRMCRREGIDHTMIPDLAIALFITGILGGRVVFVVQYWDRFPSWFWNGIGDNALLRYVALWDGGLVLYGALFGGAAGYFGFWWLRLRPQGVSNWKMMDVVAPCLALGIAFGRIGCLCTGCCYGNVACESCPALHFPLPSAPWADMVKRGHQSPLGFVLYEDSLMVQAIEPGSAADGIVQAGDSIVELNGQPVRSQADLWYPGGEVRLTVWRHNQPTPLAPFTPTSIGVNPTQVYETISMALLVFFLLSYYPYKKHDGELLVLFMLGYGVHRYLNEMLRTDTTPVAFGLTLSQNVSLLVLAAGLVLGFFVWRRPIMRRSGSEAAAPSPPAPLPQGERGEIATP